MRSLASFALFWLLGTALALPSTETRATQLPPLGCTRYYSVILEKYVPYCVDRSRPDLPAQDGEPVVYFMHGTNGGAVTWTKNNYQNALEQLRESQKLAPMTFVSFDTSAYSFFSDHPVKPGSDDTTKAYETWFVVEFIPYIERTLHVCGSRECRGLMGESMGGLGAIKTALRHPELFAAVAANSPALSPFETKEPFLDWVRYFTFKRIGPIKGALVTLIFFDVFPTDALFNENNPTWLVQNRPFDPPNPNDPQAFPTLYFDMGGHDDYGFYDGYALLKSALDAKNLPYSTLFEPGGHHDMWKRHAGASILFMEDHLGPASPPLAR